MNNKPLDLSARIDNLCMSRAVVVLFIRVIVTGVSVMSSNL